MNFFFDYIYYRITQLFFKRDGRTGFTGIAIIAIIQSLLIAVIIGELSKHIWSADVRALHSKQFGYLGGLIVILLMYYNFKKYNGRYNQYRFHWKDETNNMRIIKGFLIILSFGIPIALLIYFGVHWKK